ncbi:MAG: PKD domain-containing protein [Ferruginibacter sp.]|nr:PKD domain-containing protein [Ferruginibacter sp.]
MKRFITLLTFIIAFTINSNAQCNPSFTYTSSNGLVTFYAADSSQSTKHYWVFGNAYAYGYNLSVVSNVYAKGTYNVQHVVRDSINNCKDSSTQTIVVNFKDSCQASFIYQRNFSTNEPYYFQSTSFSNGNVGIADYLWKIDGIVSSTEPYLYDSLSIGTHQVCLNIVTASGCSSSVCKDIEVHERVKCNSNATITATASATNPREVNFTSTPVVNGLNYQWSFGDGSMSNISDQPAALHNYDRTGLHTVNLIVSDSLVRFCIDTITKNITIAGLAADSCTASFNYTVHQNEVNFTALSNQVITSQIWSIYKNADSASNYFTSNAANPIYALIDSGLYNVCLTITTSTGCALQYCNNVFLSSQSTNRQSNIIQSYPNPAINEVKLTVDVATPLPIYYTVYNDMGVPVYQKQIQGLSGANTITIPLQKLKKGQYFIDIKYGDTQKQSIFQKL